MNGVVDVEFSAFGGGAALVTGGAADFEKPCEIKNYDELGNFGGLEAGRAKPNPAMSGVRAIEEKDAHEKNKDGGDSGEDDFGLAELAVIEIHHGEHGSDADSDAEDLFDEIGVAAAALLAKSNGGGAENHHGADEAEGDRGVEKFTIRLKYSRHCGLSSDFADLARLFVRWAFVRWIFVR